MPHTVLFIFGTRPEAIKLCPTVRYMRAHTELDVKVCVTAQHREMLDQVLNVFDVEPDFDLATMRSNQSLTAATARILAGLEEVLDQAKPSLSIVQGDTTTTFCGALASFYARTPVAHVEAGLRTCDLYEPFPEELNRVLVTRIASLHFAATEAAARNLIADRVGESAIQVTGNTGIDAVLHVVDQLEAGAVFPPSRPIIHPGKKLILVTAHRRESFGEGFERICSALAEIAERPDVQIVYPVHRNPNVSGPVRERLGQISRITLIDPLDYVSFIDLMRRSWLVITDSGGIQEEAPSLGKPVLVMRDKTERPEAVDAGTAELVGTDPKRIVSVITHLLHDEAEYRRRSRIYNPYGDGRASERIAGTVVRYLTEGQAILTQ